LTSNHTINAGFLLTMSHVEIRNSVSKEFTKDWRTKMSEFENEKLKVERSKVRWTGVSILGSVLLAAITYLSAQHVQSEAAEAAFKLKVAEIAMAGTAHEAKSKIEALVKLFPEHVPADMTNTFNPDDTNWGRTSKDRFLNLIATQPARDQRRVIVDTYKQLFPGDKWLSKDVEDAAISGAALPTSVVTKDKPVSSR